MTAAKHFTHGLSLESLNSFEVPQWIASFFSLTHSSYLCISFQPPSCLLTLATHPCISSLTPSCPYCQSQVAIPPSSPQRQNKPLSSTILLAICSLWPPLLSSRHLFTAFSVENLSTCCTEPTSYKLTVKVSTVTNPVHLTLCMIGGAVES